MSLPCHETPLADPGPVVRHLPQAGPGHAAAGGGADGRVHLRGLLHHRLLLPAAGPPHRLPRLARHPRPGHTTDPLHPRRFQQVRNNNN